MTRFAITSGCGRRTWSRSPTAVSAYGREPNARGGGDRNQEGKGHPRVAFKAEGHQPLAPAAVPGRDTDSTCGDTTIARRRTEDARFGAHRRCPKEVFAATGLSPDPGPPARVDARRKILPTGTKSQFACEPPPRWWAQHETIRERVGVTFPRRCQARTQAVPCDGEAPTRLQRAAG